MRRRTTPIAAACLGALLLSSNAQAQDCSDETSLLSKEWVLAKADCGADALLEQGVSLLSQVGLNLAKTALDTYLPGISSLLFGGGDPFEKHVKELKAHMEKQTKKIIDEMIADRSRTNSSEFVKALNKLEDFADDPIYVRAATVDTMTSVEDALAGLAVDLMWPAKTDWSKGINFDYDFSDMSAPDADRFHSIMLVDALRAELIPMVATAQFYKAIVDDWDEPTAAELDKVHAESLEEANSDFALMLDKVEKFVGALSKKDMFRKRSNQRFSKILNTGNGCDILERSFRFAAIGDDPLEDEAYSWKFRLIVTGGTGCISNYGPWTINGFIATAPNGLSMKFPGGPNELLAYAEATYERVKQEKYEEFLLGAYGSVRPTLMHWYARVGRKAPILAIDADLSDAMVENSSETENVMGLLEDMTIEALTAHDLRMAEDVILERGHLDIIQSMWGQRLGDFFGYGEAQPVREIRRYLSGEPAFYLFRDLATAKLDTITQHY